MPRRNRAQSRRRQAVTTTPTEGIAITRDPYQAMAHDLVARGLASRQVLGPVPHGRRQRLEEEASAS